MTRLIKISHWKIVRNSLKQRWISYQLHERLAYVVDSINDRQKLIKDSLYQSH